MRRFPIFDFRFPISRTIPCRRGKFLLWALLVALLASLGCGRAVNGAVEKRIRERLPDVMGSARRYRVHVSGSARRADVTIDADDLPLPNSLLLDNLHLHLRGVEADARRGVLRKIQVADFTASLGINSLDEYFAGEAPDGDTLRNVRFALHDGLVTITGERGDKEPGATFQIEGPLQIRDAGQITLDPERRHITGLTPGDAVSTFLIGRLEAAVTLTGLPFPVHLSRADAANDRLTLAGSADTAAILERTQDAKP